MAINRAAMAQEISNLIVTSGQGLISAASMRQVLNDLLANIAAFYGDDPVLIGQGGLVVGNPNGADFGPGTINTQALYVNGVLGGGAVAGLRNLLINGDMRIDQRNVGASLAIPVNAAFNYIVDRWGAFATQTGKLSGQRIASTTAGSATALQLSTVAGFASGAADVFVLTQAIEGLNVGHLKFGTANAQQFTVSGIINASIAGTYALSFRNAAANRSYVGTITVALANTDTPFVVSVPGDTAGTWATDTGIGIYVSFDLGSGSNFQTTAGSWQAGNFLRTSGSANPIGTTGATVTLKDIQFEQGSSPTAFERRLIGLELGLCQRYFAKTFPQTVVPADNAGVAGAIVAPTNTFTSSVACVLQWALPVVQRIAGTITPYNPGSTGAGKIGDYFGGASILTPSFSAADDRIASAVTPASSTTLTPALHLTSSAEY